VLRRNAAFVFARARLIIGIWIVVAAISGWYAATHLGLKTASTDLIAPDNETHARFLAYKRDFRTDEDFVVLVESPDVDANGRAIEFIADQIRRDPRLIGDAERNLLYKLDPDRFRRRALFYLSSDELEDVRAQLERSSDFLSRPGEPLTLQRIFSTLNEKLATATAERERNTGDELEQLDFVSALLRQMQQGLDGNDVKPDASVLFGAGSAGSTYLTFEDGRALMLLLAAKGDRTDTFTPFDETIERLRAILAQARTQFPNISFGLTGEPVLGNDEQNTYQRDSLVAFVITIIVVFATFAYAYREIVRPLLEVFVLQVAVVIALGFAALTVGHLNMLSVAFVVMIIGIGDDFAIHMITRYEEDRAHGKSPREALFHSMLHAGHSVVMAALTVSASFGTMIFTGFLGLAEMGFIAGSGILICAILCVTLLPALLLQQKKERHADFYAIKHRITPLLLRAERAWLSNARMVILVTCVLVISALLFVVKWSEVPSAVRLLNKPRGLQKAVSQVLRVNFDYDVLKLQNPALNSVQTARRLSQLQSIYFASVTVDSLSEAARLHETLVTRPAVKRVVSILGVTDRPDTAAIIEQIRQLARGLRVGVSREVNAGSLTHTLAETHKQLELFEDALRITRKQKKAKPLSDVTRALEQMLEQLQKVDAATAGARLGLYQQRLGEFFRDGVDALGNHYSDRAMGIDQLPEQLRSRYVGRSGKYLVEIYPREDLGSKENLEKFTDEVLAVAPQATGTPIQMNIFVDLLRKSYTKAAVYALGFITFVVLIYFRKLLPAALCLVPLFVGMIFLLTLMSLTGLSFNPANIITLPLILGIGVDNGIIILERFRDEPDIELFSRNVGRAILMSNLSTVAGFGALAIARHQGIASLGLVMMIGISLTMLVSLVALPAIIRLLKERRVPM
jgi:uncharacterized protein